MADWRENYGATSAPLAVLDLVISGTSGGAGWYPGIGASMMPVLLACLERIGFDWAVEDLTQAGFH